MDEEEMGGTQPDKERRKYVYREIEPTDLTLGDILGVGAFGKVYQGCWRGGPVAVKVFDTVKLSEANDDVIDEIRKEAEMMEKLGMNPSALAVLKTASKSERVGMRCLQATIRQ
jgi:predicted Ser/Thr protein kinase